jgi:hypothetical protein
MANPLVAAADAGHLHLRPGLLTDVVHLKLKNRIAT